MFALGVRAFFVPQTQDKTALSAWSSKFLLVKNSSRSPVLWLGQIRMNNWTGSISVKPV